MTASPPILHAAFQPRRLICVGFRRWKRYNLAPILAPQAESLLFVRDAAAAARLKPGPQDRLGWWSASAPGGVAELARKSGTPAWRIEDGFYRSVGLGSDLIPPASLVLDGSGIYFDPRQPSDLETILQTAGFTPEELDRARTLRRYIIEQGLTKYNLEPRGAACWPGAEGRPVLLVPGQVEDDASIRLGCSEIRTNAALLQQARIAAPDAYIVYKPHPDVMSGNRKGRVALNEAALWADHIETDLSVISCINAADEVHVMTSQAGFDALLRGKRVVTYGQPFYAGWGLTEDRDTSAAAFTRRQRRLSLDELTAGALLRYPLYWDANRGAPAPCETVLRQLATRRDALEGEGGLEKLRLGFWRRQTRKAAVLIKAMAG